MDNQNQKKGEELNQLSRLIFDKAADLWYWAIAIEIVAGIYAVIISFQTLSSDWKVITAILGFLLLIFAYSLRLRFDDIYDTAETMRRQSVLTEALGWPIGETQFSEWRRKAGKDVLRKFALKPRDVDYYATQLQSSPKRLLEMTRESAFWTRHLYYKLRTWVWIIFCVAIGMAILIISVTTARVVPATTQQQIVYAIYLLLPILLSIDLIGWAFRLGRLTTEIKEIEKDLEKLASKRNPKESEVMRLVSEYNCQVTQGFPIHQWLFNRWLDEIKEAWEKRN